MIIKTYPLQFSEEKLREIERSAGKRKIKSFIYEAIEEKLNNKKNIDNDISLNLFISLETLSHIIDAKNVKEAKDYNLIYQDTVETVKSKISDDQKFDLINKTLDKSLLVSQALYERSVLLESLESKTIPEFGSYVYLMTSEHGVKIGKSKTPRTRTKNISTQMPFKITDVKSFKVSHMTECESFLHSKFKNRRLNGEWFNLDNEDYSFCVSYLKSNSIENKTKQGANK